MFLAFWLLALISLALLWVGLTSVFGKKTYKNAKKIYKNLTEEEEEETKGAKEDL